MARIDFNTNRLYARDGQLISAIYKPDLHQIWFHDHSRMIHGRITLPEFVKADMVASTDLGFAERIMRAYDRDNYDHWLDYEEQKELVWTDKLVFQSITL